MNEPGVTPGEVGGIIAGCVGVLVAIGHGIRWLLNFRERQANSRQAKLQIWHDELQAREDKIDKKLADYQAKTEARLEVALGQNRALRIAFELVAAPLRKIDPSNSNLAQAEQLLHAAFPLDPAVPPNIAALLSQIESVTQAAN